MSRTWLLATALVATASAAAPARAATYFLIARTPGGATFLDRDAVGGPPDARTAWETLVYAKPQTVGGLGGYAILSFHLTINCVSRQLTHTGFSAYDAHGETVGSGPIKLAWQDIAPNSVSDAERALLCDGKPWPGHPALIGSLEDLRDSVLGLRESAITIGRRPAPPTAAAANPSATAAGSFKLPPPPATAPK
jgi:hypothetical protein